MDVYLSTEIKLSHLGLVVLISNKYEYYKKAKYLSTQAKDDSVYFIHNDIGYNYRLNNLCAAVGLAQMETLAKKIRKKKLSINIIKKK